MPRTELPGTFVRCMSGHFYAQKRGDEECHICATIQAAEKLADALEQMPLGIIGWPQHVSKRTLEMRDAALAQYAATKGSGK